MEDLIEKRLKELHNRAFGRCYSTFSDFLNMDEQSRLERLNLPCVKFGGYDNAERIMVGFGDNVLGEDFPISYVEITPIMQRFADRLTHRDFLGAVMTLGIKRELIGDIIIKDNCGYLICTEKIAPYICDNLTKIKHTSVEARITDTLPEGVIATPESSIYTVSSCRADVLISAVYRLSRSEASALFATDRVFVNSRQLTSSSYLAKDGDIFSVRGFGRFSFCNVVRKTKKDRFAVEIIKYT